MNQSDFMDYLSRLPLEQCEAIAAAMHEKVAAHRKVHNGVPLNLFPAVVGIAGVYATTEIIPCIDGELFAVKMREQGDQGWVGKLHIVGTMWRRHDTQQRVFARLERDLFGDRQNMFTGKLHSYAQFVGVYTADQTPERDALCHADVHLLHMSPGEMSDLNGTWITTPCDQPNLPDLVNYHQLVLDWLSGQRFPSTIDFQLIQRDRGWIKTG